MFFGRSDRTAKKKFYNFFGKNLRKMSLSAHQARREHVLAVSRDFNSQPRLSKYQGFIRFFCQFLPKKKFQLVFRCGSTPDKNVFI